MATATPTSVTQYQTGFQPQLSPYEQTLAGSAMGTVFQYQFQKNADGSPVLDSQGQPVPVTDPATGLPKVAGFQQAPSAMYNPNQTYQGQQVAQFTPLQQQAFQNAQNMGVSGQVGQGTNIANQAAQMGLNANYQYNPYSAQNVSGAQGQAAQLGNAPTATAQNANAQYSQAQTAGNTNLGSAYTGTAQGMNAAQGQNTQLSNAPSIGAASFNQPGNVSAQQINALNPNYFQMQAAQGVSGPSLQNYQMGPASQVNSQNFTGNNVAQYMNPYLQQALNPQIQLLQQQQGMQQTANQAKQTQAGAFGGSRASVEDALQNQSNQLAMSNLIGQGYNTAYGQAAQQFNASNAANLQAQQANQQAGLTVGQQNLGANLQTQNLGATLGQQAQLANQANQQQANLQNLSANLQTQGLQAQTGLQAQQSNQSAGLQALLANQQMGYNTGLQNAQLQQQANLANQSLAGQYGLQQGTMNQQTAMANLANQQAAAANNQQYANQYGLANLAALNQYGLQQGTMNQQTSMANLANQQQTALANQQYGNQYGLANQAAQNQFALANQQLAGQYGLQQGSMNQQMGLQNLANTQQANLANQQMGLSAAQLNAQQQQFGAGYGLQGANTALTGANTLGTLGQNLYSQNIGINQLQNAAGLQQQQQIQNVLNTNYGNYMNQALYPQQQMSFLSNMYNSLPTSTQSTSTYTAPPTPLQTLGAVGTGIYGLSKIAKGGLTKSPKKMKRGGLGAIALNSIGA